MKTYNILTIAVFALATFSLAACNTIEGAGQDIENAGESVQDVAR